MLFQQLHTLPESLQQRADSLTEADRRNASRAQHRKRFQEGIEGDDLQGFRLDGQQLVLEAVPHAFRSPATAHRRSQVPGAADQLERELDHSWLSFIADLHEQTTYRLVRGERFAEEFRIYREYQQIPDWLIRFSQDQGGLRLNVEQMPVCRKSSEEIVEQAEYYDAVITKNPQLAHYIVPLIAFLTTENEAVGVMPFLKSFITFEQLLLIASGVERGGQLSLKREEAAELIPEVVKELAHILRLGLGTASESFGWNSLIERIQERFGPDHPVQILAGREVLETSQQLAIDSVAGPGLEWWQQLPHLQLQFAHGDLNATNIMIAVDRNARGEISTFCVRLIDPNPSGRVDHLLVEVARLLHWIELASPMRFSRQRGNPLFRLSYESSQGEFWSQEPVIELEEGYYLQALRSYQPIVRTLSSEFPDLLTDAGRGLLSLSIAVFHLIGTKYWAKNADRTCAFWAGVKELKQLRDGTQHSQDRGLWEIRRRMRGWGAYP